MLCPLSSVFGQSLSQLGRKSRQRTTDGRATARSDKLPACRPQAGCLRRRRDTHAQRFGPLLLLAIVNSRGHNRSCPESALPEPAHAGRSHDSSLHRLAGGFGGGGAGSRVGHARPNTPGASPTSDWRSKVDSPVRVFWRATAHQPFPGPDRLPRTPANGTTSRPTRGPRLSLSSTPPTPAKPPPTGSAGKTPQAKPAPGPRPCPQPSRGRKSVSSLCGPSSPRQAGPPAKDILVEGSS